MAGFGGGPPSFSGARRISRITRSRTTRSKAPPPPAIPRISGVFDRLRPAAFFFFLRGRSSASSSSSRSFRRRRGRSSSSSGSSSSSARARREGLGAAAFLARGRSSSSSSSGSGGGGAAFTSGFCCMALLAPPPFSSGTNASPQAGHLIFLPGAGALAARSSLAQLGHLRETGMGHAHRNGAAGLSLLRRRLQDHLHRRLQRRDALGIRLEGEVVVVLGTVERHVEQRRLEVRQANHVTVVGGEERRGVLVQRVGGGQSAGEDPIGVEVLLRLHAAHPLPGRDAYALALVLVLDGHL